MDELDPVATHMLFLARTGTLKDRHRGLTAFVTPLDVDGLQVGAKLLIKQGGERRSVDDETAAVQESVTEALEQSESGRTALEGLEWGSFATDPQDAFGRAAFAAWFDAQGRSTATSPALAGVRGSIAPSALGVPADRVAMGVRSANAGLAYGLDATTEWLVVEDENGKLEAFAAEVLTHEMSKAFDPGLLASGHAPRGIQVWRPE